MNTYGTDFQVEGGRRAKLRPMARNFLLAFGLMGLLLPAGLRASDGPDSPDSPDANAQNGQNTQAVRLSSVEGQVRVVQDSQVIADPAYANLPIFEGTQVSTGSDGRAEIQLEDGGVIRISPNSSVTFPVIQQVGTGTHTEVVLNGGLAYFELQPSTADHSVRVSYGPASFSATSFSVVRLTLDNPPGELAVFSGNVHLDRGDALQVDVHGGESLSLDLSDVTRYNLTESIQPDSWDTWNADRDQALNAQNAEKTAATEGMANSQAVGMSDLDANGNWYNVPGTGYVWSPYDAQYLGATWDPWGYGHWVFYPRFGFVWVSGYQWGYAPYSCGLWNFYDGFGWGWAPGFGCNPWWGGYGGYGGVFVGWGYNLGHAPHGYLPPHRPVPGPGHPRPVGFHGPAAPRVIAVDRRPAGSTNTNFASYVRPAQPVTLGGHTVEPLRPLAPRESYQRPVTAYGNHPGLGYYPSPSHPAYSYTPGGGSYLRPAIPTQGMRPSAPAPSMPGHTYTYSPPPAVSHPSYSGGGNMGGGGGMHSAPPPAPAGGGGSVHK